MASRSSESDRVSADELILPQAQDERTDRCPRAQDERIRTSTVGGRPRLVSAPQTKTPLGLAALAIGATLVAQTADRARTEGLAQRASERLQALQREADSLAAQEKTLLGELRGFEIQRQLKSEELRQLDAESAQVEEDLADATERMDTLQQQDLAARPELRAQVVEMYKVGQARYLRLLLSTPDVRRIGEASRTVAALAQLNRDRIASHQQTLNELASTRSTLEGRAAPAWRRCAWRSSRRAPPPTARRRRARRSCATSIGDAT